MVNTKPEHDLRLAVTHETSSSAAEVQISSWLKSFDDVEFVKKRNHPRDVVFVSNESAHEALDDIMSSEMGADSAPEKVKLSIIDYSAYSADTGVDTEHEFIVKPIGETKIEGNVDSYCDDALELFGGTLAMPDAEPSAASIANAEAKSENDNKTEDADASHYPLYGEMKSSASSELQGTLSEFESVGRHRLEEDDSPSDYARSEEAVSDSDFSESESDSSDEAFEQSVEPQNDYGEARHSVNAEPQQIHVNDVSESDFAESSQERHNYSGFADSRASSLDLTFDESDVPEFAESSEIDSKSDLERDDRLTFALDSIMPHSKDDVLSGRVGFDDDRMSQLSPQSRLSLEMSINQANSLLDNSRVDAASESESVTNEELRDEIFSAISHFSDNSDDSIDAYADAYAEAVSFANAIQVASDEIVEEYNAREDAWVAKQIDALREIYRQNNPDRTGEAIDALIEKNTPKYAELEAAANAVRPAAVAAVVRFLRKKNTKTSDAASELTRFSETHKVAIAQLEDNFSTLRDIDTSNGFEVPIEPESSEVDSRNKDGEDAGERREDKNDMMLTPASELGLTDESESKPEHEAESKPEPESKPEHDTESKPESESESDQKPDDSEIADDAALSGAMSALADNENADGADDATKSEVVEENLDDASDKNDTDSISDMTLDESLKNDDADTGEVSDFDEEEAAELPQDFMDDDPDEVGADEKQKPSAKVIAIATACAVGLVGAGTLFTGFVWPGFFKSEETSVSTEESMDLPPADDGVTDGEEQEPSDASGLYRTGDTIRVVVRGSIQNLTVTEFTPGGGAVAENSVGDKFRITQVQLDRYADEHQEQFEGRETLTNEAEVEPIEKADEGQNDQKPAEENAPDGDESDSAPKEVDDVAVDEGNAEQEGDGSE